MSELIKLSYIPNSTIKVNTLWLFQNSMGDNMNISDVVIRYMAIQNYYGKNNNGFELYSKMQATRVNNNKFVPKYRDDKGKRFKKLIKSIEEKGYDNDYPIQLNKHFLLFDGAHRLALALYHNVDQVTVCFKEPMDFIPDYSLEWFDKVNLSEYIPIIKEEYIKILKEKANKYTLFTTEKIDSNDSNFKIFVIEVCSDHENNIKQEGYIYKIYDICPNKEVIYKDDKKIVIDKNQQILIDFVNKNGGRLVI